MTITPTLEDYLKIILELKESNGEAKAMEVLNCNRIIKCFLTEVLGVDKKVSEKDACKMEHLVSGETIEKLKGQLLN